MVVVAKEADAHVEVGDEIAQHLPAHLRRGGRIDSHQSCRHLSDDDIEAARHPFLRYLVSLWVKVLAKREAAAPHGLSRAPANLRTRACDSSSGVVADPEKVYANRSSASCKAGDSSAHVAAPRAWAVTDLASVASAGVAHDSTT
jgi:hypothetical protein